MKPCPFCGCKDIDPEFWMTTTGCGPGCTQCAATAENVVAWNKRSNQANERIEQALDRINGPRESYRPLLDAENILQRICRNAEGAAIRRGTEPWVIISDITGHGSGVSAAIYRVYGGVHEESEDLSVLDKPDAHEQYGQPLMRGREMAEFYVTEERAMAPGIAGDWPPFIAKPDNPNGRLKKLVGLQQRVEGVVEELDRLNRMAAIPEQQRRILGDLAGVLRATILHG